MKKALSIGMLFLLFMALQPVIAQQSDFILGKWYNTEKDGQIEIFKEGDKFSGRIIWLKDPAEKGKPKLDIKNTDQSKRNRPIMGLKLLNGFEFKGSSWENGSVYDPKNGRTYSAVIKKKDNNTMEVRGYVGISLIGRTVEWTRVP
jgi:uncharacterized protein (DUF2147 family)